MTRTDFHLRPAVPADEPFLWDMLYHALFVPPGAAPFPREAVHQPELARYVRGWGREHDHGVVAVEVARQQPLGAAWLRLWHEHDRGYGYVDAATPELSMALLPGYRGQGVGTRLLEELFRVADGRFGAVSLSVSADNPAVRLYRRFGFREVGNGGPSLTMIRSRDADSPRTGVSR
jgi:ribosomal protein S18 acetylase RimI-like enzyme